MEGVPTGQDGPDPPSTSTAPAGTAWGLRPPPRPASPGWHLSTPDVHLHPPPSSLSCEAARTWPDPQPPQAAVQRCRLLSSQGSPQPPGLAPGHCAALQARSPQAQEAQTLFGDQAQRKVRRLPGAARLGGEQAGGGKAVPGGPQPRKQGGCCRGPGGPGLLLYSTSTPLPAGGGAAPHPGWQRRHRSPSQEMGAPAVAPWAFLSSALPDCMADP